MAKELKNYSPTAGDIPAVEGFQKIDQSSLSGATGEAGSSLSDGIGKKISDVAQTVGGVFADHSEKLFGACLLVGYVLVFNSGQLKNWDDFKRFVAILPIFILFYVLINIPKWLNKRKKSKPPSENS